MYWYNDKESPSITVLIFSIILYKQRISWNVTGTLTKFLQSEYLHLSTLYH